MLSAIRSAISWRASISLAVLCTINPAAALDTQYSPRSFRLDFKRVVDYNVKSVGDADQASSALDRLRREAPNNISYLGGFLNSRSTKPRRELAATLLGGVKSKLALQILLAAAESRDIQISKSGLTGLFYRSVADSNGAVRSQIRATAESLLTTPNQNRDFAATRVLAAIGDPSSTRILTRVLSTYGASSSVGYEAVLGLSKIGSRQARKALEAESIRLEKARTEIAKTLSTGQ